MSSLWLRGPAPVEGGFADLWRTCAVFGLFVSKALKSSERSRRGSERSRPGSERAKSGSGSPRKGSERGRQGSEKSRKGSAICWQVSAHQMAAAEDDGRRGQPTAAGRAPGQRPQGIAPAQRRTAETAQKRLRDAQQYLLSCLL